MMLMMIVMIMVMMMVVGMMTLVNLLRPEPHLLCTCRAGQGGVGGER